MDSLLDALQEGRLIELPEDNREDALQLLAHLLEAVPSVPPGTDVAGLVMERERVTSTALGRGWACPHARVPFDEDLVCVLGWSPGGLAYETPDRVPVSMIAMYLVPANQRNQYLREVSLLAKALTAYTQPDRLRSVRSLNEVRNYLLDLIDTTRDTVGPDARARMIQLQARSVAGAAIDHPLSGLEIEPLSVVVGPGIAPVVLSQNAALGAIVERGSNLVEQLDSTGAFQNGGWRVMKRSVTPYQGGRMVYDCLAVRLSARSETAAG
ncbi:MAG TPA: PTS sugar transporter subunit IIA [Gemmatimonadales bacterium]|nr:PTS sugar transporter subunit IIA [Gemmatimonadales bacterium]